jgi:ribonuclease P protein component
MLPSKNRLKKKKDFANVLMRGKFFNDIFLSLKEIKNGLEQARIGFVVSKKVSKKAVIRNRVKRLLREAIRDDLNKIKSCSDIVFFTKKGIEKKNFWEIKEVVEKLLKKSNI